MTALPSMDHLGLIHKLYPVKLCAKYAPKDGGLCFLLDSFGTKFDNIKQYIDLTTPSVVEVHLLDNTAVRNNVLEDNNLLKGYNLAQINNEIKSKGKIYKIIESQLKKTLDLIPDTLELYISVLLEHNLDRQAVTTLFEWCKTQLPDTHFVDNPVSLNYTPVPGLLLERHGNWTGQVDLSSGDGYCQSDVDYYPYKKQGNKIVWVKRIAKCLEKSWTNSFNLRFSGEKVFVNPIKRTVIATEDELRHMLLLSNPPVPAPSSKFLQAPAIFKPRAEDYRQGNVRDGKPVLLIQSNAKQWSILTRSGKELCKMRRYDPPYGNLARFYSGLGSNLSSVQLYDKNNGNEWAILTDGKYRVYVNLIRRLGTRR